MCHIPINLSAAIKRYQISSIFRAQEVHFHTPQLPRTCHWSGILAPWPHHAVQYLDGVNYYDDIRFEFPIKHYLIELRYLSPTHPAFDDGNGIGVFAKDSIQAGTVIGEYGGVFYFQKDRCLLSSNSDKYGIECGEGAITALNFGNEVRPVRSQLDPQTSRECNLFCSFQSRRDYEHVSGNHPIGECLLLWGSD